MKLRNLYEDKGKPPELFKPYRKVKPFRIPFVRDSKSAAKAVADFLRKDTANYFISEPDWKNIQRNIRIVKSNPKIADLLYDWLTDYMSKVGHVFTADEMENFRTILLYLKK